MSKQEDSEPLIWLTIVVLLVWLLFYPFVIARAAACDYIWLDDYCVPGKISLEDWFQPAPVYSKGNMVFYAPGMMKSTADYHKIDLDGYLDGVALMSPTDMGKEVWIKVDSIWYGPFISVDCARISDIYGVIGSRGEVVEVGFETAVMLGMAELTGYNQNGYKYKTIQAVKEVEVWIGELPEDAGRYKTIDYQEWWMDLPKTFTYGWERALYHRPGKFTDNGELVELKDNPVPVLKEADKTEYELRYGWVYLIP